MSKTYSAGIVTAYGAAKRAGYQGTYEDFCRQQAGYAENAAAVEQAKTTAVNAANTATAKAGEATTAATDAQTAKTQTEAAASQALTDIGTARSSAISAVQTKGAIQTANARAQAQAAEASATTASTKASEASASATSAGQSATNAAASATSAANAASAAQGVLDSIPEDYSDLSEDVDKLQADLESVESGVFKYRKKTQTLNVTATSIAASTHIMDVSIAAGMRYRIKIDDPSGIVNNHVLTVYRANSSGGRTSLGSLTTGLVYEFTAPESEAIAYFTAYKSANTLTPPGNLVTTCEYMTSDSQDSIERHVQNLERQAGDKSAIKSVAYESGSLNLPLDYYESEGKTIEILPSGSFKSTVTTLYLRYAGAESNTNLGNIAVGEKTYVLLPTTIEKVIVYSSSANAGTITLAVRTVGVKDSIETYGNILKGKKLNYLGDSITYGGAYTPFTTYLTNVYDCIARNYGIAGSTIQYDADRNPMSVRYADMDDDAEIVACMGGTNDYWNNLPLGQMGDTTYNTYYGALDVLIQGMIAKYPTAFFYMVTPPHGYNGGNFDGEAKSNAGSMQDIANAVKEVSAKYGVPVLDVFNEGGLYPKIQEQYDAYYADGVHLNNAGQQKLAQMHYKFIESHYMGAVPTVLVPSAP